MHVPHLHDRSPIHNHGDSHAVIKVCAVILSDQGTRSLTSSRSCTVRSRPTISRHFTTPIPLAHLRTWKRVTLPGLTRRTTRCISCRTRVCSIVHPLSKRPKLTISDQIAMGMYAAPSSATRPYLSAGHVSRADLNCFRYGAKDTRHYECFDYINKETSRVIEHFEPNRYVL